MRIATLGALGAFFLAPAALAQTAQPLPFAQDWTNTGLITVDDNWSGVPGIIGYRGDNLVTATGVDPQTILADGAATPVNVIANKTSPGTELSGGNYEFEIANPVVAFQGSGTADAPHIVIRVATTGRQNIRVRYNLRDIDDGTFTPTGGGGPQPADAVQPVALQFRVGTTGDYTNVPAGFVADASNPDGAVLVTPVDVTLPAAANNVASLDIRIMTTNAVGTDEFIGIDDIQITAGGGTSTDEAPESGLSLDVPNPVHGTATVRFSTEQAGEATLALYDVLGRKVATLAEGASAGAQTATLATAGLAPGVYVLRLTAGTDVLARTLTVVR